MPFEHTGATQIEVVLISNDYAHARALLEDLDESRHTFLVTQITQPDFVFDELERAIEGARFRRPVLVFIDFAAVSDDADGLVALVGEKQRVMAIECIVTRPPRDAARRERLRALGATLFEGRDEVAELARPH